jgi:hypothetical protein
MQINRVAGQLRYPLDRRAQTAAKLKPVSAGQAKLEVQRPKPVAPAAGISFNQIFIAEVSSERRQPSRPRRVSSRSMKVARWMAWVPD